MNHLLITSCQRLSRFSLFAASASIFLAVAAQAEPAMWVIRDKDSTIYLIGTLHALRHETEWNASKVKKAVAESTELWLEVVDADEEGTVAPLAVQYGIDLENPLSSKLNDIQKAKLAQVAAIYGVSLESLEPIKPWMVAVMFTVLPLQKAGYDQTAGIDHFLKTLAEEKGEKIRGFETAEEQIRFFADLSEPEQIVFLEETLGEAEKGIVQLEKLTRAWIDGDTETIGNILVNQLKKEAPGLYDKFLVQRNVAWSQKIVEILRGSGVQQIAVGAAHLAGPDSLQVQLAKRGIRVERY